MEQHPVPQNIIDVEFKLFGSFTLKQFGKILIGGLAALFFFTLNVPDIIKWPLVGISVILGLGLAMMPNLGTWLNGFLKAIFFSPRYVWIKEENLPEVLRLKQASTASNHQKVGSLKSSNKIDINEIPLDKLFGTKAVAGQKEEDDTSILSGANGADNFGRVYEDVFGEGIFQRDENSVLNTWSKSSPQPQNKAEPKPTAVARQQSEMTAHKSVEEYNEQIQKLKFELSMISKDNNYKEKEEEIISKINDLYQEIRVLNNDDNEKRLLAAAQLKSEKTFQKEEGRVVFGIVVDKKDTPLSDVTVSFVNNESKLAYKVNTSKDGKFSTLKPIPMGKYGVYLSDSTHKFHTYALDIGAQNLTAYKFREK